MILLQRVGNDLPKEIKQQADTINKQMTSVEALHQTKAKAGGIKLNYPIRLDDKISVCIILLPAVRQHLPNRWKIFLYRIIRKADEQLNKLKKYSAMICLQLNKMIREKGWT